MAREYKYIDDPAKNRADTEAEFANKPNSRHNANAYRSRLAQPGEVRQARREFRQSEDASAFASVPGITTDHYVNGKKQ